MLSEEAEKFEADLRTFSHTKLLILVLPIGSPILVVWDLRKGSSAESEIVDN